VGVAEENPREKVYGFYHATFQEYLAALAVEDWDYFLPKDHVDCPVEGKRYRIFEPQWKQVILLWLGRWDVAANDKLEFVIKLATFNDKCRNLYRVKSNFLAVEGISQLKDIDMLIPYKEYNQFSLTLALIDKLVGVALWDFDVEPKRWSIYKACLQQDAREILKRTTRTKVIAILEIKLNSISISYSLNSVFKGKAQSEIEAELKKICPDTVMADLAANNMRCLKEMSIYLENLHGYEGAGQIFLDFIGFLWELEPQNKLIISSLSSLIETTENLGTRRDAINRLEIIDPHHPAFVQALIKTLATDPDPERRNRAAQILGIINPGDPLVVNWLLDILKANQHQENYRSQIAYHLGLVDPGNIQAQAILLEIVETTQNEDIRWHLANCLERYEPGNPGAIAVLLKIIETTDDEEVIRDAFSSLLKIGKEHPDAIAGLLKIIENTDNQYVCCDAIRNLRHIGIKSNNSDAMKILLKIIESTDNKDIFASSISHLKDFYQGNFDAIMKTFIKIIETTDNEDIFQSVLWSLGNIGKKHDSAVISDLFKRLEDIKNENIIGNICYSLHDIEKEKRNVVISGFCQIIKGGKFSFEVPYYLHKIDPENPHVIPALVRVIETTDNEDTCCEAARYLHKIDPGNPHVIPALVRVIETTDNEDTAGIAIGTFSIFECNHPEAISVLSKLIQSINNTQLLETAALSLGTIDPGNTQAIITLIKINEINGSSFLPYRIRKFIKSWEGNNQAIAGLLGILETADDSKTLTFVSKMLEEVGKGNYLAISGLMKILQTNINQKICGYAAYSLAKIDPKNYLVIPELLKALETNQEEDIQWQLALQLGKVDPSNQRATEYLVGIIGANDSQDILKEINWHLKEVEWGSHFGISVIVKLLKISRDKPHEESPISHIRFYQTFEGICHGSTLATSRLIELIQSDYLEGDYSLYFEYLKRTIANQEQKEMIISALHSHLSDETYRDNFNLYLECYKLFWNCAENLSYPEFYQAWHNPPTTPHPEVTEQTPHSGEQTFASPLTWESLQHLPLYCLNADLLADETREREIALTLSELIWEITCPDEDPPE
ncbi:HEAT repeat domain-containing protein, partial [Limnoraphis robusta]|nr:HEAT repeat domain-containing protein [Limnoraphis robusta]